MSGLGHCSLMTKTARFMYRSCKFGQIKHKTNHVLKRRIHVFIHILCLVVCFGVLVSHVDQLETLMIWERFNIFSRFGYSG